VTGLPEQNPQMEMDRLDEATDQAIAACHGDMRSALRTLILANEFLEHELLTNVSQGYTRRAHHGRIKTYRA
jgi:hypothetical protein